MRILHIAAVDYGGAGFAALRLSRAMKAAGAISRMIVWEKRSGDSDVTTLRPRRFTARARRLAARAWFRLTSRRRYFFQHQRLSLARGTDLLDQAVAFRPDLIVVHYISNFLSFADVADLQRATSARVAWNLLDMASLTGGCHYAWDCKGYRHGCGDCPALPLRPRHDASAKAIVFKEAALAGLDHVVVAASSTLIEQAKASRLFRRSDIRPVFIGIDPADFPSVDPEQARAWLGMGNVGTVFFFGAGRLRERRKGMVELRDALRLCSAKIAGRGPLPTLLIAGEASGFHDLDDLGYPVVRLGYVDRETLALAYAAADFFLCPSLEDSGPMMINESIVSGTPVVSFRVGVAPDLVLPGRTGFLASDKTAAGFAGAMLDALEWSDDQRRAARDVCRELGTSVSSLERQLTSFFAMARR